MDDCTYYVGSYFNGGQSDVNQAVGYKWYQSSLSSDRVNLDVVPASPCSCGCQQSFLRNPVDNPNMYYPVDYRPPPAPPHLFHSIVPPSLVSKLLPEMPTHQVFDKNSERNPEIAGDNYTTGIASYAPPFTLTCHTTLSTSQPYYALESPTSVTSTTAMADALSLKDNLPTDNKMMITGTTTAKGNQWEDKLTQMIALIEKMQDNFADMSNVVDKKVQGKAMEVEECTLPHQSEYISTKLLSPISQTDSAVIVELDNLSTVGTKNLESASTIVHDDGKDDGLREEALEINSCLKEVVEDGDLRVKFPETRHGEENGSEEINSDDDDLVINQNQDIDCKEVEVRRIIDLFMKIIKEGTDAFNAQRLSIIKNEKLDKAVGIMIDTLLLDGRKSGMGEKNILCLTAGWLLQHMGETLNTKWLRGLVLDKRNQVLAAGFKKACTWLAAAVYDITSRNVLRWDIGHQSRGFMTLSKDSCLKVYYCWCCSQDYQLTFMSKFKVSGVKRLGTWYWSVNILVFDPGDFSCYKSVVLNSASLISEGLKLWKQWNAKVLKHVILTNLPVRGQSFIKTLMLTHVNLQSHALFVVVLSHLHLPISRSDDVGGSTFGRVVPMDSEFWWSVLLGAYNKSTDDNFNVLPYSLLEWLFNFVPKYGGYYIRNCGHLAMAITTQSQKNFESSWKCNLELDKSIDTGLNEREVGLVFRVIQDRWIVLNRMLSKSCHIATKVAWCWSETRLISDPENVLVCAIILVKLVALAMKEQCDLRKSVQRERLAMCHNSNHISWSLETKWEDHTFMRWSEVLENGIKINALAWYWTSITLIFDPGGIGCYQEVILNSTILEDKDFVRGMDCNEWTTFIG